MCLDILKTAWTPAWTLGEFSSPQNCGARHALCATCASRQTAHHAPHPQSLFAGPFWHCSPQHKQTVPSIVMLVSRCVGRGVACALPLSVRERVCRSLRAPFKVGERRGAVAERACDRRVMCTFGVPARLSNCMPAMTGNLIRANDMRGYNSMARMYTRLYAQQQYTGDD